LPWPDPTFGQQATAECKAAIYAPQQKRRYSITSSAAGSPEKQKINDDEGCDYATDAEDEHVTNVVSGHALACLDWSFDDPFVVPFRHQGLLFAEINKSPTGAFSGINAIAVRPFLQSDRAIFNENRGPPRSWW
jgi:hypothetical protein